MKCGAIGENKLFLRKFVYGVYMFIKNIFQNIVVKWGFRPVEKRAHARVKQNKLRILFESVSLVIGC